MRKEVLFLTNSGLTKSNKSLIFIAEKAWAPCYNVYVPRYQKLTETVNGI